MHSGLCTHRRAVRKSKTQSQQRELLQLRGDRCERQLEVARTSCLQPVEQTPSRSTARLRQQRLGLVLPQSFPTATPTAVPAQPEGTPWLRSTFHAPTTSS